MVSNILYGFALNKFLSQYDLVFNFNINRQMIISTNIVLGKYFQFFLIITLLISSNLFMVNCDNPKGLIKEEENLIYFYIYQEFFNLISDINFCKYKRKLSLFSLIKLSLQNNSFDFTRTN